MEFACSKNNIDWLAWAEEHIGLKKTRLEELLSIGRAEDPLARAQEIRGLGKARAQRSRDKKKPTPLRHGEEPETETSSDPTPPPDTKPKLEGDTVTTAEPANGETDHDAHEPTADGAERDFLKKPKTSLPTEDEERKGIIQKFIEWAKTADIAELRDIEKTIDPDSPPVFLKREAA